MTTPKYLIWTDHKAGFNHKDEIKGLDSKKVIDVMTEVKNLLNDEENLYCACVFERIPKTNNYKQVLRTDNGFSFYQEDALYNIRRYTQKVSKQTIEWFEFVEK